MQEQFGIEIEVVSKVDRRDLAQACIDALGAHRVDAANGGYHSHDIEKWGFEDDSSIDPTRRYPYRTEIITPPLKINSLCELKTLLTETYKGQISANKSCGVHVHVEIPSAEVLRHVLFIWQKFEERLVKFLPRSRRNGEFSRKIGHLSPERIKNLDFRRNSQVNPHKFTTYGTVEFRGHGGTTDFNKIKRWLLLVTAICKKAKEFEGRESDLHVKLRATIRDMWTFLGLKNTKTERYFKARQIHFERLERPVEAAPVEPAIILPPPPPMPGFAAVEEWVLNDNAVRVTGQVRI